jgi:prolyl oligopeptidase
MLLPLCYNSFFPLKKTIISQVTALASFTWSNLPRKRVYSIASISFLPQPPKLFSSISNTCHRGKMEGDKEATQLSSSVAHEEEDPYIWLEQVESKEALKFVQDTNALCLQALGDPTTSGTGTYQSILNILESHDRIPHVSKYGTMGGYGKDDILYNFWCDSQNPKGIWRKTLFSAYQNNEEIITEWTTVLDVDKLGKEENVSWVWKGARHLPSARDPLSNNGTLVTRALIFLSRGGADATTIREFDMVEAKFVETDGRFT